MAWTRKLSRQGNTHIVTIPLDVVKKMGAVAGELMLFEQPFSRSVCFTPHDPSNLATSDELVRTVGWMSARVALEKIVAELGAQESMADVPCVGCRLHKATYRVVELHVCGWCMTELSSAFEFRRRPSAIELGLRGRRLVESDYGRPG